MNPSYAWDSTKNEKLLAERGFGFEDIVAAIELHGVLDDISNPSSNFPHQRALVVALNVYAVVVPYVMEAETMFLKTAFPSRRATKIYLNRITP